MMGCPHKENCRACGREHGWFANYCSEKRRLTLLRRAEVAACPHSLWIDTMPGFCAKCGADEAEVRGSE
jgi:hypothetical protein